MHFVNFKLWGEMALWRHVEEAIGNYSCLGPGPGNIAGICGAAFGWPSPKSAGAFRNGQSSSSAAKSLWPISERLLHWQESEDFHVAAAIAERFPKREPYNLNGLKNANELENLRMQQSIMLSPVYWIAVGLSSADGAKALAEALQQPVYPIYLGASFCRGFIKEIRLSLAAPVELNEKTYWARWSKELESPEATPFSKHAVSGIPRLRKDGYWIYDADQPQVIRGYIPNIG
jgi:hypothetical protein